MYASLGLNELTHRGQVTYMHQKTKPSLVQMMACHLFGSKLLCEPVLTCCQWNPKEQILGKRKWKFKTFVIKENAFKSINKVCLYFPSEKRLGI